MEPPKADYLLSCLVPLAGCGGGDEPPLVVYGGAAAGDFVNVSSLGAVRIPPGLNLLSARGMVWMTKQRTMLYARNEREERRAPNLFERASKAQGSKRVGPAVPKRIKSILWVWFHAAFSRARVWSAGFLDLRTAADGQLICRPNSAGWTRPVRRRHQSTANCRAMATISFRRRAD